MVIWVTTMNIWSEEPEDQTMSVIILWAAHSLFPHLTNENNDKYFLQVSFEDKTSLYELYKTLHIKHFSYKVCPVVKYWGTMPIG